MKGHVGRAYLIMRLIALRSLFLRPLCKNCIQHTKEANKETNTSTQSDILRAYRILKDFYPRVSEF